MNDLGLSELYETAARATINQRCAPAYLHDIRGTMQALFSALELLGRCAKAGNPERVQKASELAKRAISKHEKSTLDALEALTLQDSAAAVVDIFALVNEVVRFLRNDAADKEVVLQVAGRDGLSISTERARLQTALVGLLIAAIDEAPHGSTLLLSVIRIDDDAVISVDTDAGYGESSLTEDPGRPSRLLPKELTLIFARRFLGANGGRLQICPRSAASPRGALHLHYPIDIASMAATPTKSVLAALP